MSSMSSHDASGPGASAPSPLRGTLPAMSATSPAADWDDEMPPILDENGEPIATYSSREQAVAASKQVPSRASGAAEQGTLDLFGTPSDAHVTIDLDAARAQRRGARPAASRPAPTRPTVVTSRAVSLSREDSTFRLAFAYNPELVERAKTLPAAKFDSETRTWTTPVSKQAVTELRGWHLAGLTDVSVDDLLAPGEEPAALTPASLRRGSLRRPFLVAINVRDEKLFARLRAIPGSAWEKNAGALSYPASASAALAELVDRGTVDDPEGVLSPAAVVVAYDARTGGFGVRGDARAASVFEREFPRRDVMAAWTTRGLDVAFADSLSEEVYRGEVARACEPAQPPAITLPVFPHQARNAAISLTRSGFLIADEPGVGKTVSGLSVLAQDLASGAISRAVVVCPAAVRTHWRAEIARFTDMDELCVAVAAGDAKRRTAAYEAVLSPDDPARILVVHYDVLSRDLDQLKAVFAGATVVFDEAHRLKTRDSARTKAARTLVRSAHRRVLMTGTPVMNDPGEFYSLVDFAVPGALGSWSDFAGRYMYPHPYAKGAYTGARNLTELRRRSAVHFVRHTKAQVAEHLPPLRVQTLVLDTDAALSAALRRAHREARDEIAAAQAARATARSGGELTLIDEPDDTATGADMTAVGALRMMCTSPRLLHQSDSASAEAMTSVGLVPDVDGPKIDWIRETAAQMQAAGERLVVFTFFARAARLLAERFTEDGTRFVLFTGDTSSADRDAAVAAFTAESTEENPGPTVFLATDAAAEGLNLGRQCSTLVNLDLPWVPSTLVQRSQRIHRIDGTHPRYRVVNLVMAGTLEAGLLALLERKADIAGAILGESNARRGVTGRRGRQSVFEEAMAGWKGE